MIVLLNGEESIFADIITRRVGGSRDDHAAVCSILLQEAKQVVPSSDAIEWPDIDVFRSSQSRHNHKAGIVLDKDDEIWKKQTKSGSIMVT